MNPAAQGAAAAAAGGRRYPPSAAAAFIGDRRRQSFEVPAVAASLGDRRRQSFDAPAAEPLRQPYDADPIAAATERLRRVSSYGFHNLDRRTAVLADGSVRSYLALPADYRHDDFSDGFHQPLRPPPKRTHEHADESSLHGAFIDDIRDGRPSKSAKLEDLPHRDGRGDGRLGKSVRVDEVPRREEVDGDVTANEKAVDVDQRAVRRAFLKYAKEINENSFEKKNYLADGKNGKLKCIACDRSKDFVDVHGLVSHTYNSQNQVKRAEHLGLHKALCVLLGWDYAAPENSKAYESLSDDDAAANRKDLILWPPTVIIQNTSSGQKKDGLMQGLGNKDMDSKLKDLGFSGGKSKSVYGKDGHTGVTVVKFANTQAGLKEAESLADHFEKENHGLEGWEHAQASQSGDDDSNPALVKVDGKSGEKKRIFYGYMATVSDLEAVDRETRKKSVVKSRKEFDL